MNILFSFSPLELTNAHSKQFLEAISKIGDSLIQTICFKNKKIYCWSYCCKQASNGQSVIYMAVDDARQKMTSTHNNI